LTRTGFQSFALHRQQIGRCLRPKPDGAPAIIVDHVGNVHRHGLPDAPHQWSLDTQKRTLAERQLAATTVRRCRVCTEVFSKTANRESCPIPDGAEGCTFRPAMPRVGDGVLEEIISPPWANGIDIRNARGWRWYQLLQYAGADTARLRQIQVARNYKKGWIHYAQQAAAEKQTADHVYTNNV
jgi:superfamily II DNA or RNA helicase